MGDIENRVWLAQSSQGPTLLEIHDQLDAWTQNDFYQNLVWRLGDRWRLAAGLRAQFLPEAYTRTRFDGVLDTTTIRASRIEERVPVTGRVSAQFDATNAHRIYVAAGTASQQRDQSSVTQPEEIRNVEIGHVFTSASLQIATTVFANDVDHIITRTLAFESDGSWTSRVTNDGRWRSFGLELRSRLRLGSSWHMGASVVAQRTRDRAQEIDVGYSPAVTAKAFVDWTQDVWRVGLHTRYVGAMSTGYERLEDAEGTVTIDRLGEDVPGYVTVGANVRRDFAGGFFAALHVSNLFDAETRDPANEVSNMERGLIGMGRVVGLTVGASTW